MDAVFVKITNSDYTMTTGINGTSRLMGAIPGDVTPSALVGSTIYKSGMATGYTSGTVLSANANQAIVYPSGTGTLTNCIKSSTPASNGDSGGPLFSGHSPARIYSLCSGGLSNDPDLGNLTFSAKYLLDWSSIGNPRIY